jgi:hypothetical protein
MKFFKELIQFEKEKVLADDEFILANLNSIGFYRVNYDKENWNRIIKQLLTKKDVRSLTKFFKIT